jgi:hypothetical protein
MTINKAMKLKDLANVNYGPIWGYEDLDRIEEELAMSHLVDHIVKSSDTNAYYFKGGMAFLNFRKKTLLLRLADEETLNHVDELFSSVYSEIPRKIKLKQVARVANG